ncbi:MAG: SUF system NifU family Fe-S cluster assembly protein [Myxococcales bacterium]|nr:SUF system NifU family Fe-S cluster assembly protein [Myxococcales bacterium]
MNPTLRDLYQRIILQHNSQPQNLGPLPQATHQASLHNALCGDQITLRLRIEPATADQATHDPSPRIVQACFEGDSCALCRASASLMTQRIAGTTPLQALVLAARLRAFLSPPAPAVSVDAASRQSSESDLGDLAALQGVREVPARLRCATLPWEALMHALQPSPR